MQDALHANPPFRPLPFEWQGCSDPVWYGYSYASFVANQVPKFKALMKTGAHRPTPPPAPLHPLHAGATDPDLMEPPNLPSPRAGRRHSAAWAHA